jgi:hypothetical protein
VAGGATFSALATGGDDKPSSHEVSMNAERKPPTVATPKPVVDEPRPVDEGMKIEYNHPIPPKTISCEGNPFHFLIGCSMVTGAFLSGPLAPLVILKGLDEMQAGISGKGTIVYNKALEAGLSERGAFIVDVATSCPDAIFAVPKGLFKGAAKSLAEVGPRSGSSVAFSLGGLADDAAKQAAKETAKAMARNPEEAAVAAGKILAPQSGLTNATRLTADELATGRLLEEQIGRPLQESAHEGAEFVDELGRSYDALGVPKASQFWNEKQFLNSIDEHLLKSNDFTAINLTGFTPAQIDTVRKYLATLTPEQLARIIRIGF